MNKDRELEVLAAIVHGILAAFHVLGFAFNLRRRNRFDAAVHGAAMVYDTMAAARHARAAGGSS